METIINLAFYLFFAWCCSMICRKAGLSTLWVVMAFVPLLNIFALYYVAFAQWPRFAEGE